MLLKYVWADLIRNPRRTLSTAVGVMLGVGLSCAILFFVDGLSASMTQRAVAPLAIDMQRILTEPLAGAIELNQVVEPGGPAGSGDTLQIHLTFHNQGDTPANEVIIRSVPNAKTMYMAGTATRDDAILNDSVENPFANGPAKAGLNIGTIPAQTAVHFTYELTVTESGDFSSQSIASSFSTREILTPISANATEPTSLSELAEQIETLPGITFAEQLSFVDLAPGTLAANRAVDGAVRLFGFDSSYTQHDNTIKIVAGEQRKGAALISAEAATYLAVNPGDIVSIALPDGSQLEVAISGIADLTQARSLFSSRQGANLETFIYLPNTIIIDSSLFDKAVIPAFERAVSGRGERVKSPPVREIDIGVDRELLDAEPAVALLQTQQIAEAISGVAGEQDFLLDNISNTLAVARNDATVAKRMFTFLGTPGAILAAMLAAYAGIVLAGAQRREQATLRIRGASRRHLLSMLAMRVSAITLAGAGQGVALGFLSVVAIIGYDSLARATASSLITSALLGTLTGLFATGAALYITGRRSIDREINEERARLAAIPPTWRRYWLDLLGLAAVLVATLIVISRSGFEGTPGSVYVGRPVELPLALLFLPIGAWIAGSFLGGRVFAWLLQRFNRESGPKIVKPVALLYRMSLKRRPWDLVDAAIIVGMIVALGTSLAVFTASYNGAKSADARFTLGSDIRITPSPANELTYQASDATSFLVSGVDQVAPVIYGVHNVILRSNRTSDIANLAALDPESYARAAPLADSHFGNGSALVSMNMLATRANGLLLSTDMAGFLQASIGDTIQVLLARGRTDQVEVTLELVGTFERLPGFPDGANALMNIELHEEMVPATGPAFFLAQTSSSAEAALSQAVAALRNGPGTEGALQIDTHLTALAKDQSSLAALNIGGLLKLDSAYSLAMGTVTIAIFVFGLLLQRRREYVTLKAQGMQPGRIRLFIGMEAGTAALAGCAIGVPVGLLMAYYLINVLRPLFVLNPPYLIPGWSLTLVAGSVLLATGITTILASSLVNRLEATELLRDE